MIIFFPHISQYVKKKKKKKSEKTQTLPLYPRVTLRIERLNLTLAKAIKQGVTGGAWCDCSMCYSEWAVLLGLSVYVSEWAVLCCVPVLYSSYGN